jgi:hypothetical protein
MPLIILIAYSQLAVRRVKSRAAWEKPYKYKAFYAARWSWLAGSNAVIVRAIGLKVVRDTCCSNRAEELWTSRLLPDDDD